jgi:DNA replication protein DnaC
MTRTSRVETVVVNAVICDEVGFALLDDNGPTTFSFVAAAYERRSLAIASDWPFEQWDHFLPNETTAVSPLDRLTHHGNLVVTDEKLFRMKEARQKGAGPSSRPPEHQRGGAI